MIWDILVNTQTHTESPIKFFVIIFLHVISGEVVKQPATYRLAQLLLV